MTSTKIIVTTTGNSPVVVFTGLAFVPTLTHPVINFELTAYDTKNNILANQAFLDAVGNRDIIATDEMGVPVNAATVLNIVGSLACAGNPNYPAATKGESYKVSTAGKVGGASGDVVQVGDVIQCITSTAGGTSAAVGENWIIIQGNILAASETVAGYIEIATDAECLTGTDDARAVTPLKMATYVPLAPAIVAKCGKGGSKTIGFPGDTGKDFTWTSAADTTEQNLDLGALIPAKAVLLAAFILCTQTVSTGTLDLALGTASSGEQIVASANNDAANDITAALALLPLAPAVTAQHIWLQGTRGGTNWSAMSAGRHTVYYYYAAFDDVD